MKRKKKSREFLDKIKKFMKLQNSNSASLFDLFQSNTSSTQSPDTSKKLQVTDNLFTETVNFLKDEIEEIEMVRNILKAEDDRLNKINSSNSQKQKQKTQQSSKEPVKSKSGMTPGEGDKPVMMNIIETTKGYEVLNAPTGTSASVNNKHETSKEDKKGNPFLTELNDAENALKDFPSKTDNGEKSNATLPSEDKVSNASLSELTTKERTSKIIPVESTAANPDEAKREGESTNFTPHKAPREGEGTVFTPIEGGDDESPVKSAKLKEGITSPSSAEYNKHHGDVEDQTADKDNLDAVDADQENTTSGDNEIEENDKNANLVGVFIRVH